ncbi:class I SAM-dependent methyltransferase [Clostridium beijerinckii]|uniref:class I SAM-dependent methyltransferase n=1 Tax=Clostridium beijerinckii TaxID=1520 RepID=UPI0003D31368|nr:class I SAM-dependent methyltransferase [Clostridium beijerinckii]
MDFTGERLVLDKRGIELLELEHLHRYNSVSDLVKDKIVLDIACGTGYGSALLAKNAKYVYGVDISQEAIDYCNEKYNMDNLNYQKGSISEIPLEDSSIDVIISFETIEHVNEELQRKFKKEIVRVLKPDGLLIMSTPDKYVYSDIPKYNNEFHVKEFYNDEFKEYFADIFKNTLFFNQGLQICDIIDDGKEIIGEQLIIKGNRVSNNLYPYIIAVCSNEDISKIKLNSFILDNNNSLFLLNRKFDSVNRMLAGDNILVSQKNIIEQKENYIEEQREIIEQKENYIGEQKAIIEQKENYIGEQRAIIEQKENYIGEQRAIIEQKENYIGEQREIIEQKENCIEEQREIIEQKENYISEQRAIIEQKENYICEQRETIEQKEAYISEQKKKLNIIEEKLKRITESKGYKIYKNAKKFLGRKV